MQRPVFCRINPHDQVTTTDFVSSFLNNYLKDEIFVDLTSSNKEQQRTFSVLFQGSLKNP